MRRRRRASRAPRGGRGGPRSGSRPSDARHRRLLSIRAGEDEVAGVALGGSGGGGAGRRRGATEGGGEAERLQGRRKIFFLGALREASDAKKSIFFLRLHSTRAAELYRQILSKEVAKSATNDALPSSPVASEPPKPSDDFPEFKLSDAPTENLNGKQEPKSPKAPQRSPKAPTHPTFATSVKKPIGAKKVGGKTGGLGVRKLTTKPNESLYDQKPEEPKPVVPALTTTSTTKSGPSLHSRFEYVENEPSADSRSGGSHVTGHVAPPKSSDFFQEYGMGNGFQKKSSNASKTQIQETDEARKKFSNAKAISSSQFFGTQNREEKEAQMSLQKFAGSSSISSADLFGRDVDNSNLDISASDLINRISFQASQDLSSLKDIAGETGKKLTSLASNFISDLDRML